MAIVQIHRGWNWIAIIRGLKITANGQPLDKIGNDTVQNYEFLPGHHILQVNMDKLTSKPFEFDVVEGQTTYLRVGINITLYWLQFAITFVLMMLGLILIVAGIFVRNGWPMIVIGLLIIVTTLVLSVVLQYTVFKDKMYYIRYEQPKM